MGWVARSPFWAGLIIGGISLLVVSAGAFVVLSAVVHQSADVCHAVNQVNTEITGYITRQAPRIGAKGTLSYHFYHTHPDLLKQAQQNVTDALNAFHGISC